jgi:hypothetical protein
VPPSGRAFQMTALITERIVEGLVVERWELWDNPGVFWQLGLV